MTDTRDLFERTFALCDRQKWQHKDGSYKDGSIQAKWEGWQRALETVPAPAAAPDGLTEAWKKVREEVGTEGWTVADSVNYFGFFSHGWRAALGAAAPAAPSFLQWWTLHDVDERTDMIRNAIGNRENTLGLARMAFDAGIKAAQLATPAPTAPKSRRVFDEFMAAAEQAGVTHLPIQLDEPATTAPSEPVEYQHRMRPTWGGFGWTEWQKCSAGQYEDCIKTPVLHDWQHEVRKLYAAPAPTAPLLSIALEALDKLARLGNEPCLGNSHGNVIAQDALRKIETATPAPSERIVEKGIEGCVHVWAITEILDTGPGHICATCGELRTLS